MEVAWIVKFGRTWQSSRQTLSLSVNSSPSLTQACHFALILLLQGEILRVVRRRNLFGGEERFGLGSAADFETGFGRWVTGRARRARTAAPTVSSPVVVRPICFHHMTSRQPKMDELLNQTRSTKWKFLTFSNVDEKLCVVDEFSSTFGCHFLSPSTISFLILFCGLITKTFWRYLIISWDKALQGMPSQSA